MTICILSGRIQNAAGGAVQDACVSARPRFAGNAPAFIGTSLLSDEAVETVTDQNGAFSMNLEQGIRYVIDIYDANYHKQVLIPLAGTVQLKDL